MSTPNIDAIRRKVDTQDRQRNKLRTASHQTKGYSGGNWVVGIIVIFALAVFISESNNEGNSSSRSSSSPNNSTAHVTSSTRGVSVEQNKKGSSSDKNTYLNRVKEIPKNTSQMAAKGIDFSKPPVGTNNVLKVEHLRWCLRQDFRLAAKRSNLNTKQKVIEFNSMIVDYNRRCVGYQLYPGSLKIAIRDVFEMSSQIVSGSPRSTLSQSEQKKTLVIEIQILLQYLSYKPGVVDGIYGKYTRKAIKKFERKIGENNPHGKATEYIRDRLKDAI